MAIFGLVEQLSINLTFSLQNIMKHFLQTDGFGIKSLKKK